MGLTLRLQKGTDLTYQELDDNFSELDQRISGKANATHTHGITEISGLQDELDGKIDMEDTNVPNGLLLLGSDGKVPCELLKDCFDVAGKVSESDLYDTNGIVKVEKLPPSSNGECNCEIANIPGLQTALDDKANTIDLIENGKIKPELLTENCDCDQINADISALQQTKADKLKVVRKLTADATLEIDEDIVFLSTGVDAYDLSTNVAEGRVLDLVRYGDFDIALHTQLQLLDGTNTQAWAGTMQNNLRMVYSENQWMQIF